MESMKNKLEQDMLSLLESGEIVFQCQGEKIKAHRNILSARYMLLELRLSSSNDCLNDPFQ